MLHHGVDAADIQIGVLLPGERHSGKILRGRRRAHGDGDALAEIGFQALVCGGDLSLDGGGDRSVDDLPADRRGAALDLNRRLVVDAIEHRDELRQEPVATDQLPIRRSGDAERARDR